MAKTLDAVEDVDIDTDGRFKYVLIKVSSGDSYKNIVRGYNFASYHADIVDKVQSGIEAMGLTCECVGGGRIQHNNREKCIHVYGYSMGFGRADHSVTVDKLKKKYPDYAKIDFSNEGY